MKDLRCQKLVARFCDKSFFLYIKTSSLLCLTHLENEPFAL